MKGTEVLIQMRNGWELGEYSRGVHGYRFTLQKGGLGRGGKTIMVPSTVIRSLERKQLIIAKPDPAKWYLRRYLLVQSRP